MTDDGVVCTIRGFAGGEYLVGFNSNGKNYHGMFNYRWARQENGDYITRKIARQLVLVEAVYSDGLDNWV